MNKYVVLIFCFFIFKGFGQTEVIIAPSEESVSKEWENWVENIPVSGGLKVGLMNYSTDDKKLENNYYYVKFPLELYNSISAKNEAVLFAEFSSVDGRYSGKLDYLLKESNDQTMLKLGFPSKFLEELEDYSVNDIVVLVNVNVANENYFLIASWDDNFEVADAVLYLNSQLSTYLKVNKLSDPVRCEELKKLPLVAYNKKCVFPKKNILGKINKAVIGQREKRMGQISVKNSDLNVMY